MGMAVFLFGPPLVCLVVLAALPAGAIALTGHLAALLLWGIAALAIYPLRPSSGPDDWFRGIETVPHWASLGAIALTGPAQIWRWVRLRSGQRPHYILALLVCGLALAVLFATFTGV